MRDMRDWLNSKYLSAMDLMKDDGAGYHKGTVEIASISDPQSVQLGPEKERLPVATFRGKRKQMILRDNHIKKLVELFGPDADAPVGKKVGLWVELDVNCFGTKRDCVRFEAANGQTRRSLLPSAPKSEPVDDDTTPADEVAMVAEIVGDEPPDMSAAERTAFDEAQGDLS